jgi:hypothetical protein
MHQTPKAIYIEFVVVEDLVLINVGFSMAVDGNHA